MRQTALAMAACALASCGGLTYQTDKQWCDAACATLLQCGVQDIGDQAACSANCQTPAASVFLACAKGADPTDCNAMAICAIKQTCGGLVPSGSTSCQATATCEANCAGSVPCGCACLSSLQPSKARNILINNNCALAFCAGCPDPQSCGACLQTHCSLAIQQCQQN